DRSGPQIQIHRRWANQITEQHQNRSNEKGNLRGAAQRDSYAEVETVFSRCGKCCRHFGSSAHQSDNDEPNESRTHSEGGRSVLNGSDKHFAYQRHQNGNDRESEEGKTDRPRSFMFLGRASKQFAVRIERKPETKSVSHQ